MEFTVFDWMIDSGLRGNELFVFAYIHTMGACAQTQAEIGRTLGLARQSVNTAIACLLNKGFISCGHDDTGKNVYLSEKATRGVKISDTNVKISDNGVKISDKSNSDTLFKKINNNNIYITHTNPTRTREDIDIEWHDAPFAERMANGIANGGTMRDDMVRSLAASTGMTINVNRLAAMADAFAADQRVADSNHTNDGDFRMHFIRWAASILKAEAKQKHVDEKVSERNQRRNMTSFERAQLAREQAERRFVEDMQRRLNDDMNNGR